MSLVEIISPDCEFNLPRALWQARVAREEIEQNALCEWESQAIFVSTM
jgi:hypothetical protein